MWLYIVSSFVLYLDLLLFTSFTSYSSYIIYRMTLDDPIDGSNVGLISHYCPLTSRSLPRASQANLKEGEITTLFTSRSIPWGFSSPTYSVLGE